jgi:3-methyladenine DNA glycosylase/8-oxoguanine DNA glycosylase
VSDEVKPKGYLAKYGERLIRKGYRIVPIRRGTKMPPFDKWSQLNVDQKLLQSYLDGTATVTVDKRDRLYDGSRDGVGILTADTPLVDIDVKNDEISQQMRAFVELMYGDAPVRVGMAPKQGLLFRAETPFTKVQSSFWIDPWSGEVDDAGKPIRHKVEILGSGQQFVAYAKHPDTGRPYEWVTAAQPAITPASELPVLTQADAEAIVAEFERIAEAAGWERQKGASRSLALPTRGQIDTDDVFAEDAQIADIAEEELERLLMLVPGADEYDVWFQVGMALYHQYEGGPRGLELWHQFSAQAHNYDSDALDEKWPTFNIESKGRAPVTARLIIKLGKSVEQEVAKETLEEIKADLAIATDLANLKSVCGRIKQVDFEPMVRIHLVGLVQGRFKAITNQQLPVGTARDMTRFESLERKACPKWLEGFIYCEADESFYSITERRTLTTTAFNQSFGRKLLTPQEKLEGKSAPEQSPSQVALNLYEIPIVHDRRYFPGEDELFWLNGIKYVNTYDGRNVPEIPEKLTKRDRHNVEIVVAHFEHLFAAEKDREVLIDAIAFLVQNPGRRLNWAILAQGTEGDGKTFFFRLFTSMLALENVMTVGAQAVEEKYTSWAEGAQLCFIEEIRLHGHNRYDVLNRLKPLITNSMVPIRRMQTDTYMVPNMTTYFLATNYKDALPLNDNDSRYFVLFSRYQTKEKLAAFKAANPKYYDELHDALAESPGAVRKWFLEREIAPSFKPDDRAPESVAKAEMIRLSKSDEQEGLEKVLAESPRMDMSRQLLNVTDLADELEERGFEAPYGKSMSKLLLDSGFTKLGKVWIKEKSCLFWSQEPSRFMNADGKSMNTAAIRQWIDESL